MSDIANDVAMNSEGGDGGSASSTIRLYGTVADSIVDGPGLRYAIFVQGCSHHCPGCHNPKSQDLEGGTFRSVESVFEEIVSNGLVSAVTFSGGEPFEQPAACAHLACMLKERGYDIWAYSGYLYEDLLAMGENDGAVCDFLKCVDVLVDGPFVESLKSMSLDWRGSSNQRLIDVTKSELAGKVVEWKHDDLIYEKPPSW